MNDIVKIVDDVIKKFFAKCEEQKKIWVAYSGGVDSHVLLHALVHHKNSSHDISAIHVHHGLQTQADAWREHCIRQAQILNVSLEIKHVNAKPAKGQSPEAAAREARYTAFSEIIEPGDVLVTAHNQNDQAETIVLQLIRGAGVKGLAAMPLNADFNQGILYRPFLEISRAMIVNYANVFHLKWIEDPSNENTHFDRNFLRQTIFPLLADRWPSIEKTLSRSAEHCASASDMLDELAHEDLDNVLDQKYHAMNIEKLLQHSIQRQKNVLRYWIEKQKLPLPSTVHLDCLLREGVHAADDKIPCVQWPGAEVRRFKGFLFAMPPVSDFDSSVEIVWDRQASLKLPADLGVIEINDDRIIGRSLSSIEGPAIVRFRQGGEVMKLPGREGRHELKKLFQEWSVLPWRRDRVPLIYSGDELIAVLISSHDQINVCN
ncbi:MAG: tRNA lysidine(34) synthetase TilS [Gammaproteobacteria bacterium]|nr:tRNA lysidine(34) synthetase TilS [Gammaproteobacteria bacterium]